MELRNRTGFPATAFRQFDRQGALDVVVAVRGTFELVPGGVLAVAVDQEPLQWEDFYDGDPATTPLLRQADLVPYKPGTDVTLLGDAHCPDPAGAPAWTCGLRILAPDGAPLLDKTLRVTGPRAWHPRARPNWRALLSLSEPPTHLAWDLSAPDPAHQVALDWRLARGGPLPDEPGALDPDNPVGRGIVGPVGLAADTPVPAPQIEALHDPITDITSTPAGLGPLSPWWRPRAQRCGTGALAWPGAHQPALPGDFDERFWQCAPPDQVVTPWLRGTERFELHNLHPDAGLFVGTLPGIMPGLTVQRGIAAVERAGLNLDGVHFDLRPGWDRVVLTWRVRLPMPARHGVRLTLHERARLGAAPAAAPARDRVDA